MTRWPGGGASGLAAGALGFLAAHLGDLVDPFADVFAATCILGLVHRRSSGRCPERVHRMPEDRWRQARPAPRPRAPTDIFMVFFELDKNLKRSTVPVRAPESVRHSRVLIHRGIFAPTGSGAGVLAARRARDKPRHPGTSSAR